MTTATPARSHFQGVLQIIRFNRRMYLAGLATLIAALWFIAAIQLPRWMTIVLLGGTATAPAWLLMSIVVSYVVYDLSSLCCWTWIAPLINGKPGHIANIHAGFDESSASLKQLFPNAALRVFDIYDPKEMTEPSIAVARKVASQVPAEAAEFRKLPLVSGGCDVVTLLLAAHELRSVEGRVAFLGEVKRALAPGGRVILAEHMRDLPNFLAFGPGFTHFHSRRTWLTDAANSGLMLINERSITPFVRIFVFERSNP